MVLYHQTIEPLKAVFYYLFMVTAQLRYSEWLMIDSLLIDCNYTDIAL